MERNINKKLEHLCDEDIQELIRRYYCNENISLLLNEYRIEVHPSQLVTLFPQKITNKICPYCEINLRIKYSSRPYSDTNEPYCPSCQHREWYCLCKNCRREARVLEEIRRIREIEFIQSTFSLNNEAGVSYELLTFEERVYLGALLREGISEDYQYIKPVCSFINILAPTNILTDKILLSLKMKKIIVVHPSNDPKNFDFINVKDKIFYFDSKMVKWDLNVKRDGVAKWDLINSLINPDNIEDPEKCFELWKNIALQELLQYLLFSIKSIMGVDYTVGDKTIKILSDLLKNYSVSQIHTIIYRSINDALRFQFEKRCSKNQAANTVVGIAQSFAERAAICNWDVYKRKRDSACPESALSKFFFERILKIGYAGFNEKPRLIP